jgi:hypothetical protein
MERGASSDYEYTTRGEVGLLRLKKDNLRYYHEADAEGSTPSFKVFQ